MQKSKLDSKNLSNRSFGFLLSGICFAVFIFSFFLADRFNQAALFSGLCFFVLGVLDSVYLMPLKLIWLRIAMTLTSVCNAIIVTVTFFVVITPFAVFGRLLSSDPLRLSDGAKSSFWRKSGHPPTKADICNMF